MDKLASALIKLSGKNKTLTIAALAALIPGLAGYLAYQNKPSTYRKSRYSSNTRSREQKILETAGDEILNEIGRGLGEIRR